MRKIRSLLFTAGIAAVLAIGVGASVATTGRDVIKTDAVAGDKKITQKLGDTSKLPTGWSLTSGVNGGSYLQMKKDDCLKISSEALFGNDQVIDSSMNISLYLGKYGNGWSDNTLVKVSASYLNSNNEVLSSSYEEYKCKSTSISIKTPAISLAAPSLDSISKISSLQIKFEPSAKITTRFNEIDLNYKTKNKISVANPVTAITVETANNANNVLINESLNFTANITPVNADIKTVKWSVDDSTIANIDENTGVLTGKKVGSVVVTAKSTDGTNVTGTKTINVIDNPITSIVISKNIENVYVNDEVTFTATVEPADATFKDVEWSVDNNKLATIDSKTGVLTALAKGTVVVSATARDSGKLVNQLKFDIKEHYVTAIEILGNGEVFEKNPINEKSTLQLSANLTTVDGFEASCKDVVWTTDVKEIGTISQTGLFTALAPGKVKVTAKATDNGNENGEVAQSTIEITVLANELKGFDVQGTPIAQRKGEEFDPDGLSFNLTYAAGNVVSLDSSKVTFAKDEETNIVNISYEGFKKQLSFTVDNPVSLSKSGNIATQIAGKAFNPNGLSFKVNYESGVKPVDAKIEDLTFTPNILVEGSNKITATHKNGVSITFEATAVLVNEYHSLGSNKLYEGSKVIISNKEGNKIATFKSGETYLGVTDSLSTLDDASAAVDALEFSVEIHADYYAFKSNEGYLSLTGNSNKVEIKKDFLGDQSLWEIREQLIDEISIYNKQYVNRILSYNSPATRFACYKSVQDPIRLNILNIQASNEEIVNTFIYKQLHMRDYDKDLTVGKNGPGLCSGENGYYALAKQVYGEFTPEQKALFATNKNAVARLSAWALANNEEFKPSEGIFASYTMFASNNFDNIQIISIVAISFLAVTSISIFVLVRHKKSLKNKISN